MKNTQTQITPNHFVFRGRVLLLVFFSAQISADSSHSRMLLCVGQPLTQCPVCVSAAQRCLSGCIRIPPPSLGLADQPHSLHPNFYLLAMTSKALAWWISIKRHTIYGRTVLRKQCLVKYMLVHNTVKFYFTVLCILLV